MVNPPLLATAVASAQPLTVPFVGVMVRASRLHFYCTTPPVPPVGVVQPLYAGVRQAGSRFVRPNGPPALYLAQDADTAHREACQSYYSQRLVQGGQARLRTGQLRPDPVVMIGVFVRLGRVMDLRSQPVWGVLGIQTVAELTGPWFGPGSAPTQLLGEAVYNDSNFEGILYPSARNAGHTCLVLFPSRLAAGSVVNFHDTGTPGSGLSASLP